jgi:hypothetical protein
MDGNLTVCQKSLKSELVYPRKATRLREGQTILLEQPQCELCCFLAVPVDPTLC